MDVDVQVDLEIACATVNTTRLEHALRNTEFGPDSERVWRWVAEHDVGRAVVRFELLADLPDAAAASTVVFESCENLGAVNRRGTGFAARDVVARQWRPTRSSPSRNSGGCRSGRRPAGRARKKVPPI